MENEISAEQIAANIEVPAVIEAVEAISEAVSESAAEIIAENEQEKEIADAAYKALLDAMMNSEEYRQRVEFENRIYGEINELREGLNTCLRSLETFQSEVTASLMTATEAAATTETLLSLATSNLPSEAVEDLQNQTEPEVLIDPANPPIPVEAAPASQPRAKHRLL